MEETRSRSWRQELSKELNESRVHTDVTCQYQVMHHVMVHEAGHAAFAIRRGIPFAEIRVYPPKQINEQFLVDGRAHAGGLQLLDDNPANWIPERPEEALDMIVAGALAERFFFNCYLDRSHEGDMRLWSLGMGLGTNEPDRSHIDLSSVRVWAEMARCVPDIEAIFHALQGQLKPPVDGESIFDEPLALSQDEVMSLMTGRY